MIPRVFESDRLQACNLPLPAFKGSQTIQAPRSEWSLWLSQFNWINWLGLSMFLVVLGASYIGVHAWLLNHDLVLYYASLYAQLGLLLMAWRQL